MRGQVSLTYEGTLLFMGLVPHVGCRGSCEAWAWLSPTAPAEAAVELEPTCLCRVSPVLIDRACQLMGLLINTSGMWRPDEIIATSGIKHVEVAPAWHSSGGEGELEIFASFGQHGMEFDPVLHAVLDNVWTRGLGHIGLGSGFRVQGSNGHGFSEQVAVLTCLSCLGFQSQVVGPPGML